MGRLEEILTEMTKPGTQQRKYFYGGVFLLVGLLFVTLGFWKTILVAALTAIGLMIGSSNSLGDSLKGLINKVFPPAQKTVSYSSKDIQKVKQALNKQDNIDHTTAAEETQAENPAVEEAPPTQEGY